MGLTTEKHMERREIEELLDETKRMARASDKVALNTAIGILEVARQLSILNETLGAANGQPRKAKAAGAGKK